MQNAQNAATAPSLSMVGIGYAAALVLSWSAYNVAAKAGIDGPFRSQDISGLRYGVAALLFLPLALTKYLSFWRSIGLWRIFALAILGGPLFGTIAVGGFTYAPLSHGMLFAPATVMTVGNLLSVVFGGDTLTARRLLGMAVMVVGLAILVGFELGTAGKSLLIGEALFVLSGAMWGSFTFLLGRWKIEAVPATCIVGATAGLLAVPLYFMTWGGSFPDAPASAIALQALMQGVIGGGLAVFILVKSTEHLGTARTALLPVLTPAVAIALSAIFVGTVPTTAEVIGSIIVMGGLTIAMRN